VLFLAVSASAFGKSIDLTPKLGNDQKEIINTLQSLEKNIDGHDMRWVEMTVNNFTDQILAITAQILINQGLDPMPLPDFHRGLSVGIIIDWHGELNLTKGWVSDTSSLYRGGDSIVRVDGNLLTFKVPINFVDFLFDYNYLAEFMGIGPSGTVDGKVDNVEVYAEVSVDFDIKRITLLQFKVVNTGKINLNFHGNPLIDWLLDLLSDVITLIFDGLIYDIAENIIAGKINEIIDQINIAWNSRVAELLL